MSESAGSSRVSKYAKFIHSPRLFFADSKSTFVRTAGLRAERLLSSQDGTARFAYQPLENLAKSSLPVVASVARLSQERMRRARTKLIQSYGSPLVSIVMPAHKAEASIVSAIESLLGQQYSNLEILVVDDSSSDATYSAVEKITKTHPRVRLLSNDLGRGAALARNVGMQAATGKYLTFQDADDVSVPERIEHQLAALLSDRRAVLSRCDYSRVDKSGQAIRINGRIVAQSIISMMFNRTVVLERIGYMQNIPVSEDFEFYRRIKLAFSEKRECHIFKCHYLAGFEPDSLLFSDGQTSIDSRGEVVHERSEAAEDGLVAIDTWHAELKAGADPYVAVDGTRHSSTS